MSTAETLQEASRPAAAEWKPRRNRNGTVPHAYIMDAEMPDGTIRRIAKLTRRRSLEKCLEEMKQKRPGRKLAVIKAITKAEFLALPVAGPSAMIAGDGPPMPGLGAWEILVLQQGETRMIRVGAASEFDAEVFALKMPGVERAAVIRQLPTK